MLQSSDATSEESTCFKLDTEFVAKYASLPDPTDSIDDIDHLVWYLRTKLSLSKTTDNERWYQKVEQVVNSFYRAKQAHQQGLGLEWNADMEQQHAKETFTHIFNDYHCIIRETAGFTARGLWKHPPPRRISLITEQYILDDV